MTTPKRPLFLVNPVAGGGRGRRVVPALRIALRARGLSDDDIQMTQGPGHAMALAVEAAKSERGPVVGVGGDGTLQEIANGLMAVNNPPVLGVIPVGTGNDFARSLRIPAALDEAVAVALCGTSSSIDLGRCGERYFLNIGGAGFDAQVSRAVNTAPQSLRVGALPFVLYTLRELINNRNREMTVWLDGGPAIRRRVFTVSVGNGPFSGGGMRICPDASREDGLLDVCIVGDVSRPEVVRLLPQVFSGAHVRHPKVEIHRAASIRVEGPPDASVHVDGEVIGTVPVEFGVTPAALRVVTPP
ncbi:MAG TPA: diacylglycerol kinase family protein [Chloroflexota bacterium]|nr:diacylglycerol kinase family protein [Chloroflexota bacterium]